MVERETGIEPATNSLEGCDSTTELLPHCAAAIRTSELMELTERLELSTSPLPRECSTTELRQHVTTNLTSLPKTYRKRLRCFRGTKPPEQNAEGEKSQQNQAQRTILAWLHREPGRDGQGSQHGQRNDHASGTGRAEIHDLPQYCSYKINGAQGRIRTSVTRRVADLQSAAINRSATCAHLPQSSLTQTSA
jgi:hypothetical protein